MCKQIQFGGEKMIPIYSFWCDKEPTNEEIESALARVSVVVSIIQLKWLMFGTMYHITVRTGMSIEDCKAQIPKVYPV